MGIQVIVIFHIPPVEVSNISSFSTQQIRKGMVIQWFCSINDCNNFHFVIITTNKQNITGPLIGQPVQLYRRGGDSC